jgi:hypothetical protein
MKAVTLFLFFGLATSATAQMTYQNLTVQYDSAITYKNLKLIPIVQKNRGIPPGPNILSLGKAIQKGLVTVSERGTASTENVHWLRINNKSNKPLYIASGEILVGGRQDRMVTKDTILMPAGADQYVSVMCVEEDRWSEREKKFSYFNYANPRLRKVVDQSKNQVLIWNEIFKQLDSTKTKSLTQAYAAQRTDKRVTLQQEEYLRFFRERIKKTDSTWVGFVCMSGDKILGCDIFAGNSLFYDQVEPLLNGHVEEAINTGKAVLIKDDKVKKYMDKILTDEKSQAEYLKKNGKIFRHQGTVIHLTGFGE